MKNVSSGLDEEKLSLLYIHTLIKSLQKEETN